MSIEKNYHTQKKSIDTIDIDIDCLSPITCTLLRTRHNILTEINKYSTTFRQTLFFIYYSFLLNIINLAVSFAKRCQCKSLYSKDYFFWLPLESLNNASTEGKGQGNSQAKKGAQNGKRRHTQSNENGGSSGIGCTDANYYCICLHQNKAICNDGIKRVWQNFFRT